MASIIALMGQLKWKTIAVSHNLDPELRHIVRYRRKAGNITNEEIGFKVSVITIIRETF